MFDPATRRAFLAVGKDRLPDVIPLLVDASGDGVDETRDGVHALLASGVLREKPARGSTAAKTFLAVYQRASFDYPFFNYSEAGAHNADIEMMHRFAASEFPPAPVVERAGAALLPLPQVSFSDLQSAAMNGKAAAMDPDRGLSHILHATFAPVGTMDGAFHRWLYKTSPSGGARHPTEGVVLVGAASSLSYDRGAYFYDVGRHGLVGCPAGLYDAALDVADSTDQFALLLTSRVERPMWRYREFRSFRPVLLDAGHVAETASIVGGICGFMSSLRKAVYSRSLDFGWLREPELALVAFTRLGAAQPGLATERRPEASAATAPSYLTNPTTYFTFRNGELVARAIWPARSERAIDYVDFEILTHCTPSRRGDRVTTPTGIQAAYPHAANDAAATLAAAGLLLPRPVAESFYGATHTWARYGWYLSLLAHLETRAAAIDAGQEGEAVDRDWREAHRGALSDDDVATALVNRRTCRSFRRAALSEGAVRALLSSAGDSLATLQTAHGVFLSVLDVDGLRPGVYEYDVSSNELVLRSGDADRGLIRTIASGQAWVGNAAIILWLVTLIDPARPENFEQDTLVLSRTAQRLCVKATAMGIAVFTTPATNDAAAARLLQLRDPQNSIVYMLAAGPSRR